MADNGTGKRREGLDVAKSGLGTSIVNALAEQLDARMDVVGNDTGTVVTVSHTTSTKKLTQAA